MRTGKEVHVDKNHAFGGYANRMCDCAERKRYRCPRTNSGTQGQTLVRCQGGLHILWSLGVSGTTQDRWTYRRTLERCVQEGTFLLHRNGPSKEVADLRALAELAPRFFAEQDYRKVSHQPYSHHVEKERVEFCAAASSNRALPTPSFLSARYLHHSVT